ncbi:MAG: hypothetical protein GY716_05880 [bacterium]|nr:hypothetical protein [bacterium]
MKRSAVAGLLYAALVVVFLLHNDLWLWDEAGLVLGLPVGLTYHIGFCLGVSVLLGLLVRFAWPAGLGDEEGGDG